MLLPDITPAVERIILASMAWQEGLNSPEFMPEHLLLGMLHEEEGTTAVLLNSQQITRDAVLKILQAETLTLTIPESLPAILPSLVSSLVYEARDIALQSSGNALVHGEHVLHALLRHDRTLFNKLPGLSQMAETLAQQLPDVTASIPMEEAIEPPDLASEHSLHRILDANFNRATEAMRILEEYARFHLNDAFLCSEFKQLRHDTASAYREHFPYETSLLSRDTTRDVGTHISTESESLRNSLLDVFRANMARLHQALRVLEEYGKVITSRFGSIIERLRYRSYVLEKACLSADNRTDVLRKAQIYLLVSKASCAASLEWTIQEAAAGGVTMVQLREKEKDDRDLLRIAREVRTITSKLGLLFIMNDRPDIARLAHADGVHVGQEDLQADDVRKLTANNGIVGISTHDQKQLEQAILDRADYVGIGPVFPSNTKSFTEFAGIDFIKLASSHTALPRFAIGGIDLSNISQVVQAGIRQVAVGRAITMADDPRSVTQQMMHLMNQ